VLVLVILAGAAASYQWNLGDRWFGASPTPAPAPAGFTAPPQPSPQPVAQPAPDVRPDAAAVRRALGPGLKDPHLAHLRALVAPLTGRPLLSVGHGMSMPASTLKLLTATAALEVLGPDHTFVTRVVRPSRHAITLVGGGDPFLAGKQPTTGPASADASLQHLAALTARQLTQSGVNVVHLSYDASLFTGPQVDPYWPKTYIPEQVVSPISALWADQGVAPDGSHRVADPARAAAAEFATYLRHGGVRVAGPVAAHTAPVGARELAHVTSPPLATIVEQVLQISDNEGAEVLARQVGLAVSGRGSFKGGVAGVRSTLLHLGIDLHGGRWYDGSGLSRRDRIDARTLIQVLQVASESAHPELRAVVTGLPVAAFNGSLTYRFTGTSGRGWVRAKTGTLTGTSALAGMTTDARGHVLVFAFVSNHVPLLDSLDVRAAQDQLAGALASCRC
jgi:serine-type D-Ala-D-Ala carboxypeptidase/endopeptidase (penicillin-binding protein 4)